MSYHVYISRRTNGEGADGSEITLEEWRKLVDTDPELAPIDDYHSVRWNGLTTVADPTFDWDNGEIVVINPDSAQYAKTVKLAASLGACVIGEADTTLSQADVEAEAVLLASDKIEIDALRVYNHPGRLSWSTRNEGLGGVFEYLIRYLPICLPLGGFTFVFAASRVRPLQWPDYAIAVLAACWLVIHAAYSPERRKRLVFEQWLVRNLPEVIEGNAAYRGVPITLDTQVTRYWAVYSFVWTHSEWSRWCVVGVDDRGTKWVHSAVSLLFGSWGLPFGPFTVIVSLLFNLSRPGGDRMSVRNLILLIDDRLVQFVGKPDRVAKNATKKQGTRSAASMREEEERRTEPGETEATAGGPYFWGEPVLSLKGTGVN